MAKKTPLAQTIASAPPAIKNRIVLVLDTSGSMGWLAGDAMAAANGMLRSIREQTLAQGQSTEVAVVGFDNHFRVLSPLADARAVRDLVGYACGGGTALYDAVAYGAEVLGPNDPDTSYLVLTFTDGEENASQRFRYYSPSILEYVAQRQKLGNWTFAFQMPQSADRAHCARVFGVPADNVRTWEVSRKGVQEVERTTSAGITDFYAARAAGHKAVTTFYATTDLSKVTAKQVHSKLDDISDRFKVLTVPSEQSVKEFVEAKTGKAYVVGSAYYQLMKPEKVQPKKAVLIMEKGKKAVWGGDAARGLIGLPTDGTSHAKVTPGNHANYDIFVQSRSVNRKLPRGTRVLVDTTKMKDDVPTWDHTAVAAK